MAHNTDRVDAYYSAIVKEGLVSSKVYARRHLEDLFKGIDFTNKRVLDIGGGSGVFSFCAGSMGAKEVVCMEPESKGSSTGVTRVFDRLRSRLPYAPVVLDTRTIQEYPQDEGQFDVIVMHASINHLDEPACIRLLEDASSREIYKNLLARVAALSVQGGKLVVSDCSRYNFFALLGVENPLCPSIEWHKHHRPEVWARLLEEVGYRHAKIRWEPLYRFGKPGKILLGNVIAAYFLKSMFRLEMERV